MVVEVWWGGRCRERRRVGSEGDGVGDPASGTAQGILVDLGGRGGCGLKRTTLRLLTCLVRALEVLWHLDEQVRRPRQPTSLPITLCPVLGHGNGHRDRKGGLSLVPVLEWSWGPLLPFFSSCWGIPASQVTEHH